jgi:hypothetical protein
MGAVWPWVVLLAIAASVIGAVWLAAWRAGKRKAQVDTLARDIAAAERMTDARETAPADPAALADRLRGGGHL